MPGAAAWHSGSRTVAAMADSYPPAVAIQMQGRILTIRLLLFPVAEGEAESVHLTTLGEVHTYVERMNPRSLHQYPNHNTVLEELDDDVTARLVWLLSLVRRRYSSPQPAGGDT